MSFSAANSVSVPHSELTKLTPGATPDSTYVRILTHKLYANAGSIPMSIGSGQHGHIGMLISLVDYSILAGANAPLHYEQYDLHKFARNGFIFIEIGDLMWTIKIQWPPRKTNKADYFTKHLCHLTILKSDPHTFI